MKLTNPKLNSLLNEICALNERECEASFGDCISLNFTQNCSDLVEVAKKLKPWRKGPFSLNDSTNSTKIDAEWQSFFKFNLLKKHFDLNGKIVADVGCNNGYYAMKFAKACGATKVVGFDPSELCYTQFCFVEKFAKSGVRFELCGVESLPFYETKFDTIFCLGVIYHRSDPVKMLKELRASLLPKGEVFLDTMFIERDDEFVLSPKNSYSKIPNIYFVPSQKALQNWCERAGFRSFEVLESCATTPEEQRKTEWIDGQSLCDFLDPSNPNLTVEGYPAPKRLYVKLELK